MGEDLKTPEYRAKIAVAYVNAVGWEDGDYGDLESLAGQRLLEAVSQAIREAVDDQQKG